MIPQVIAMQSYEAVRMQRLFNCLSFKRPEAHFWKKELHQKFIEHADGKPVLSQNEVDPPWWQQNLL